jgi:hypothetical protein
VGTENDEAAIEPIVSLTHPKIRNAKRYLDPYSEWYYSQQPRDGSSSSVHQQMN